MKFKIVTHGCQMNEYESGKIRDFFISIGFEEAADIEDADFVYFNSCAVREKSEDKLMSGIGLVRSIYNKRGFPFSIVSGCVATISEKRIRRVGQDSVKLIIKGTDDLTEKEEKLKDFFKVLSFDEGVFAKQSLASVYAYVPVIFGCDSFCSYCIVPTARGREKSRLVSEIVSEVKRLLEAGTKEIILLGQNINHYGKDLGLKNGFIEILESVDKLKGLERLRFMTSHPADFDIETLDRMQNLEHLMPHFHLPVQSGSNRILELMKRGYTREYYLRLVEEVKERFKEASITTDIIVGFPTETDEEYLDTEKLVKEIQFDKSFIAAFSKRGSTPAALMDGQIDENVKKERHRRLLTIQNEITREINRSSIGKTTEIIVENSKEGKFFGRTPQDKLVIAEGSANVSDTVRVQIYDADENHLKGKLIG